MSEFSASGAARAVLANGYVRAPGILSLRGLIIFTGIAASILYVVVGLAFELQLYADGSVFSYGVAVRDAWDFHWHNISGRIVVYLVAHVPAEFYVWLTGDARGGIAVYGFLFFGAPLGGLALTYLADGSRRRDIFTGACLSTACLAPLVFGYPTEMWISHALFWPALATCHHARPGIVDGIAAAVALTALALTHESGVVFAVAVVGTVLLRGLRDPALHRAACAFLAAMMVWGAVKFTFPPDDYFAGFLAHLARNALNLGALGSDIFVLLAGALLLYAVAFLIFARIAPAQAHVFAALVLVAHWVFFDDALHAEDRYYLRTALLIATPLLGAVAAFLAVDRDGRTALPLPLLPQLRGALAHEATMRAAAGAVLIAVLVHTVESAKFVSVWVDYKAALRSLVMSSASNPKLGHPQFVSPARIDADLDRVAWQSTSHFLSVLVAPQFAPQRIVADPRAGYFWISCETATENEQANRTVPVASRRLIRLYSCLHR